MTLANEGTSGRHSTNEDVASKPRWITRGDIKLHGHLDSRMKDHGFASIRRYVRKSSSMTLNEVLCGRQPDLLFYIYINMTIYIALFNRNIK